MKIETKYNFGDMNAGKMYMAVAAGLIAGSGQQLPYQLRKPEPKQRKCLLPTCQNMTSHNGGYCCAEHCKEHRKLIKRKNNAI